MFLDCLGYDMKTKTAYLMKKRADFYFNSYTTVVL